MRSRWTGHLFQSRFASVAMDEDHLIAAVRYVSLNPVRAWPGKEQSRNFRLDGESPRSDVGGAGRHPGRVIFDIVYRKK